MEAEPLVLPPVADPTTLDVVQELGQVHRDKVKVFFQAQMEEFKASLVGQTFPDADWRGELKDEASDYTKTEIIVSDLDTGMMFLIDPNHYHLGAEKRKYYNKYFGYIPKARTQLGLGYRKSVLVDRTNRQVMIDSQEALERFCAYWQAAMDHKERLDAEVRE